MVAESDRFLAFCPYASRFGYETWVLPRRHASHYEDQDGFQLGELCGFVNAILARLESVLGGPAYNLVIHTAPFDTFPLDHYHWHIEIIPRLVQVAGFEWGAGYFINTVSPEEAARKLRIVEAR